MPNLLGPVVVYATLTIPQMILFESFLSFLGLGVQEPLREPGQPDQRRRAGDAVRAVDAARAGGFPRDAADCFNLLGDGLRDALDPREH